MSPETALLKDSKADGSRSLPKEGPQNFRIIWAASEDEGVCFIFVKVTISRVNEGDQRALVAALPLSGVRVCAMWDETDVEPDDLEGPHSQALAAFSIMRIS